MSISDIHRGMKCEQERIAFIRKRDGEDAAYEWAQKILDIYSEGLCSIERHEGKVKNHLSINEFKWITLGSIFTCGDYLELQCVNVDKSYVEEVRETRELQENELNTTIETYKNEGEKIYLCLRFMALEGE